jgi:hypothetical protein
MHNFVNDVIIDSPHLGGMKSTAGPSIAHGGGQPSKRATLRTFQLEPLRFGSIITVLVVAVDVEEVKVVVADLHQTLAELILALFVMR